MARVSVEGKTDTGLVRSNNEDSYAALGAEESPAGVEVLLVVADGMGGHAQGEVASRLAVDCVVHLVNGAGEANPEGDGSYSAFLAEVLQDVNLEIFAAGRQTGMGTTCTVAAVRQDNLHVAHVGDSRAYIFRAGELLQVTRDHTWVEEAVARGSVDPREALIHPNRHVITRAIGLEPQVEVDTYTIRLENRDLVLLCSDGLNYVQEADIATILQTQELAEACGALIEAANSNGGVDNTTVVLACFAAENPSSGVAFPAGDNVATGWKRAVPPVFRRSNQS